MSRNGTELVKYHLKPFELGNEFLSTVLKMEPTIKWYGKAEGCREVCRNSDSKTLFQTQEASLLAHLEGNQGKFRFALSW